VSSTNITASLPKVFVNNDNKLQTQAEPTDCTECGLQFRDGDKIYFDNDDFFTYTYGRTVRNRYQIHEGVREVHATPKCEEAKARAVRERRQAARAGRNKGS
jgi:hypothetical protein